MGRFHHCRHAGQEQGIGLFAFAQEHVFEIGVIVEAIAENALRTWNQRRTRVDAIAIQFTGANLAVATFNIDLEVEAGISAGIDDFDIGDFLEGFAVIVWTNALPAM